MKVAFAQISSAGPVRPNNEDWVAFWEPADDQEYRSRGAVAALADGVGGQFGGEGKGKISAFITRQKKSTFAFAAAGQIPGTRLR